MSNSALLQLEELVNKKNYTDDGKRVIRYSYDYHSNDIKRTKVIDDEGLFVLYDEYKYKYENGHYCYEKLSSMEIYKDNYGNMHLVDPDVFIPHCQYECWTITGSLPPVGQYGGIYIVRNSSYDSKEEMEEALQNRKECSHRYDSNHMSSVYEKHKMCHCELCGKSWTRNAFKRYYEEVSPTGAGNIRYVKYDIIVIRKGGKDYVTARAEGEMCYGYDGPRSHIIASSKHYLTASNIILAARAFYELGYFDYEESAYIYVMYGANDDFIRGISAEYPAGAIGKFIHKVLKKVPKIMYVRSKMKDFDILESTKDEVLNDWAYKVNHPEEDNKKHSTIDYDGLEKYVDIAKNNQRRFGVDYDGDIGNLLLFGKETL